MNYHLTIKELINKIKSGYLNVIEVEDYLKHNPTYRDYFEKQILIEAATSSIFGDNCNILNRFINEYNKHGFGLIGITEAERAEYAQRCKNLRLRTAVTATSEPQQRTEKAPEDNTTKPDILLNNNIQKAFGKAIKAGLIVEADNGYKWAFGGKVRLAYFLNKVFNKDGLSSVPYKRLEGLFMVSGLAQAYYQSLNAKSPQKWTTKIDETLI